MKTLRITTITLITVLSMNLIANQTFNDMIEENPADPYVFSNSANGYGYELKIEANPNPFWTYHVPIFTLSNTSSNTAAEIVYFKLTIGDQSYNFDHLGVEGRDPLPQFSNDLNGDGSYSDPLPDYMDNHIRSDFIVFEFDGFDSSDVFTFISDIDNDQSAFPGSVEDFRVVLWNNDEIPNSVITVGFSAPVIPTPGAGLLTIIGACFSIYFRRSIR